MVFVGVGVCSGCSGRFSAVPGCRAGLGQPSADRKHPMDCGVLLSGRESSGAHMRRAVEPVVAVFIDLNRSQPKH